MVKILKMPSDFQMVQPFENQTGKSPLLSCPVFTTLLYYTKNSIVLDPTDEEEAEEEEEEEEEAVESTQVCNI
jgi:hypothetical protein